jgi:putative membrane protein
MKNSILTVLAVAAMVACKKNETTTSDQSADTTATMSAPADTSMTTGDSATTAASNSNTATNALSAQDKKFADAAATGGMMEVMLGQLASSNASNATVKSLGAMMVKDHGKANDELKKWASASGYTLPTSLNADQQKKYDDLKAKKGAEFDRMYADLMVSDHQKDIAEFKKQASEGSEASLKSFASTTLPTLEHHLMESEKSKTAVK